MKNSRIKLHWIRLFIEEPACVLISLSFSVATALYSTGENNHVFQFPMTGKLKIDVHITGNPPPNRILLKVSQDNSSSPVPVSSLEYSTTYNSTAGSDGGILTLVLSVGLEYGRDSFYSLELSNGIISPTQCEYNFFLNVSGGKYKPILF